MLEARLHNSLFYIAFVVNFDRLSPYNLDKTMLSYEPVKGESTPGRSYRRIYFLFAYYKKNVWCLRFLSC